MIFAAGFGKRMMPLTKNKPKPLLEVKGKPLLERILDDLVSVGVDHIAINAHYLVNQVESFIEGYQQKNKVNIKLFFEPDILETGGGIVNALSFFAGNDFFVVNGDNLFQFKSSANIYSDVMREWDPKKMNALFLLNRKDSAQGYIGKGDFDITENGKIICNNNEHKDYVFAGVHITKYNNFVGVPEGRRPVMEIYKSKNFENIYSYENRYKWFHVGDPKSLKEAEKEFKE